jgi:hypothetical protein
MLIDIIISTFSYLNSIKSKLSLNVTIQINESVIMAYILYYILIVVNRRPRPSYNVLTIIDNEFIQIRDSICRQY